MSDTRPPSRSPFTGLALILIGVYFLLRRFAPGLDLGHIGRFWPVLLILWGLARIYETQRARRSGQAAPALLTGSEALVIFFLVLLIFTTSSLDWVHQRNPDLDISGGLFDRAATNNVELPSVTLPAGARVTLIITRGSINVHGAEGNELHIVASETAHGTNDRAARENLRSISVSVQNTGDGYLVQPSIPSDRTNVDLDVQLPKTASLVVQTGHGDLSVADAGGAVQATVNHGAIDMHDLGGAVAIQTQGGSVHILSVQGPVEVRGKGDEVELGDIAGSALLQGEFFGPINLRNIAKSVRISSSRTDLTIGGLKGRLESDPGHMEISDASGNLSLTTKEKDITLENVTGRITVDNRHGNVELTLAQPPRDDISLTNDTGDVTLTLPAKSAFSINATARSGEIDSDFPGAGLIQTNDDGSGKLEGSTPGHGPVIKLQTNYGAIHLHRGV